MPRLHDHPNSNLMQLALLGEAADAGGSGALDSNAIVLYLGPC
ncbi:hypothetical protein [Accumulibacter sp.]